MNLALAMLVGCLIATGQPQNDSVQVLLIGRIIKIDLKAGVITVRERVFPERSARRDPPSQVSLGPDFSIDIPRRGRGGIEVDTKVVYSSATEIKSDNKPIDATQFKVGDSVRVVGRVTNKDIRASEIERLPKKQ